MSRVWHNRVFDRTVGASYDWVIERPAVARRFAQLLFGADADEVMYGVMGVVAQIPDGSAVLDVPCGGGIAMRRLRAEQRVRYVAADISPAMLARARQRTPPQQRGTVEFVETTIEQMPFSDGEFDLCVCFNGLHCVPDPAAAVREVARCLRSGGQLVGDVAIRGQVHRSDAWMSLLRAIGTLGPAGTLDDAQHWFTNAGLTIERLHCSGAIAHFHARRPHKDA